SLIKLGKPEDGIQTHGTAPTPTPDGNARGVHISTFFQKGTRRCRLVGRCEDSDLPIDALAPRTPSRCRRPPIVHTHNEITLLGQHAMPQKSFAFPNVQHALTGRLTVYVKEDGVFLRRGKTRGFDAPTIEGCILV